jgi:hypothetical protein
MKNLYRVEWVMDRENRPGTPKLCAIAHENGRNMRNGEFSRRDQIVYRGLRTVKIGPEPLKLCAIAHENGQNIRKRRVFTTRSKRVPRVTDRENRLGTPKHCAIANENGQNM